MNIPWIKDCKNIKGKKVLLRLDFNVPIERGIITDTFRIEQSLPTIDFLKNLGAKIIIISHLGKKTDSLEVVAKYLTPKFPLIRFVKDLFSISLKKEISSMKDGDILILENLRSSEGEESNNDDFAKYLASLADIYVNDAFSASHREHASIVGVAQKIPSYGGLLLFKEVSELSKVFTPDHPFLLILGGAKAETKLPMIQRFWSEADHIFIGGALANDFFKAKGYFVGESLVSNVQIPKIFSESNENEKIILPIDVRTQHKGIKYVKKPNEISIGERIWDIGPKSEKLLSHAVESAEFIVWNGPMGYFEGGEKQGTQAVAKMLSKSTATTIVGGGDTLSAIKELGLFDSFSFVSTGGGAMLEFLSVGTLPGIEVLKQNKNSIVSKGNWFSRLFGN